MVNTDITKELSRLRNCLDIRYMHSIIKNEFIIPAEYKTLTFVPNIRYKNEFISYDRGLYSAKMSLYNTFPSNIN